MVIDTKEISEQILGNLKAGAEAFQNITLFDVAVGLWTVAALLAVRQAIIVWKKRKGYRMAVRERTTKETELLTNILGDGLFEAELAGKISEQRMNALLSLCEKKLNLPDLVPKQRRLKIVKEELKARLFGGKKKDRLHRASKGDSSKWHKFHNTQFSETLGEFANKFWKKAG